MITRNLFAVILIFIGIIMLIDQFQLFYFEDIFDALDFENFWPIIPSLFAITFWVRFFNNVKDYELIMPATIFTFISVIFWITTIYGSYYYEYIWPLFILGPAVGLWLMQLSPYRTKDYLTTAIVLSSVAFFFLYGNFYDIDGYTVIGIILAIVGLTKILRR